MINETEYADQIINHASKVQGWLTEAEMRCIIKHLREQVNQTPPGQAINWGEIGAYKGRSTTVLCMCAKNTSGKNVGVISIDPHQGELTYPGGVSSTGKKFPRTQLDQVGSTFNEYMSNVFEFYNEGILDYRVAKVEDVPVPTALFPYLDAIFIDGLHDFDSVKKDYEHFKSKYSHGHTLVMFHDCDWEGPDYFTFELLRTKECTLLAHADSLRVLLYA